MAKKAALSDKKRASDESTPPAELQRLALACPELARLVAQNAATPSGLLEALSTHTDAWVRRWVILHPATPLKALLRLAEEYPDKLLDNPALDLYFMENPALLDNMPSRMLRAILKRPRAIEALMKFTDGKTDRESKLIIAGAPLAPPGALEKLSHDRHRIVRRVVASNPFTPFGVLEKNDMRQKPLCACRRGHQPIPTPEAAGSTGNG